MTRNLGLAALLSLTLAGCAIDPPRRTRAFDEAAFVRIVPGLAAEKVLQRLGTPTRVAADGQVVWYYATTLPPRSPIVAVAPEPRRLGAISFTAGLKVERAVIYAPGGVSVVDATTGAVADERTAGMWRLLYDGP